MNPDKPATRRAFMLVGAGAVASIALSGCGRDGGSRGDTGATAPASPSGIAPPAGPSSAQTPSGSTQQSAAATAPTTTPPASPVRVDENGPLAKSLNYRHDASKITDPRRSADQYCDNCQFYQTAAARDDWAPCPLFQNQLVAAKGWCSSWVKKT